MSSQRPRVCKNKVVFSAGGDVDVKGITSTLISQGYTGWFVLEQDNVMRQEPDSGGGPMVDAKASVEFLRAVAAEATV